MKILQFTLAAIALAALPLSSFAVEDHKQTKECMACCKTAEKCDACCKDKGKECGKQCCAPKSK